MVDTVSWALTDFSRPGSLILWIEGVEQPIPIAIFSMSYALNEIPTAQCILAAGTSLRTGQNSPLHSIAADWITLRRARVVFRASGDWNPSGTPWPEKPVALFDGYSLGIGYRMLRGKLLPAIQLVHFLTDLGFASTISRQAQPSSEFDFTYYAAQNPAAGANADPNGKQAPSNVADLIDFVANSATIQDDVWSGIKDYFCEVSQRDFALIGTCGVDQALAGNPEALAALARMEGGTVAKCKFTLAKEKKSYYKPLKITVPELSGQLADALARYIQNKTVNSMAGLTLWDVLVGDLAPMCFFKVVPMADRAIIAAVTPGLREPWKVEVRPDDWLFIDTRPRILRPLKAVAVHSSQGSSSGIAENQWALDPSGCFTVADPKGMALHMHAPPWLAYLENVPARVGMTTGFLDGVPIPNALTPEVPRNAKPPQGQPATKAEQAEQMFDLFDRIAHWYYLENMLRGRTATLSGKLRFDIAPGSNILVHKSPTHQTAGKDKLLTDIYGTVGRVMVTIDAEAHTAETTFELQDVRHEAENKDDRTSVDKHPIYQDASFTGAPLVDEFSFQ